MSTNNHLVKVLLNFNYEHITITQYQAHIMDKSNDLQIYELPLKNFCSIVHTRQTVNKYEDVNVFLHSIQLELESKTDGPYKIEVKYIEFIYDHNIPTFYEKYNLPIFLKI